MFTKMKMWLGFPIPAWLVVVIIFLCFYVSNLSRVKPPEAWIEFSLKSIEKIDSQSIVLCEKYKDNKEIVQYSTFIREYMFLQLMEYKQLFRMFYGELPIDVQTRISDLEKKMKK